MKQTHRTQYSDYSHNRNQHVPVTRPSHTRNLQVNRHSHYKPPQPPRDKHQRRPPPKDEQPRAARCLNCGNPRHPTSYCPSKEPKCFKCRTNTGINLFSVPTRVQCEKSTTVPSRKKVVHIADTRIEALIDTGSSITAINETAYSLIKKPQLSLPDLTLTGLGKTSVKPLGFFNSPITIDNNVFKTKIYVIPKTTPSVN